MPRFPYRSSPLLRGASVRDKTFRLRRSAAAAVVRLPSLVIDKRDLLETRVITQSCNQHVRLLPPEPWLVFAPTKFIRVDGADLVMESLITDQPVFVFDHADEFKALNHAVDDLAQPIVELRRI